MSELNLTDKITETITSVFKKTKVFEKMEKIQFYIGSFVFISSIIGLSSIYINYCNLNKIKNLEEKIEQSENILKYNIQITRRQHQIIYNKLIEQLKNEVEMYSKLLNKITESQNFKPEMLSASTSMSSFSPIRIVLPPENNYCENNNCDIEDINIFEDNELMNECYDSIPMNNAKKTTGLNWIFTHLHP